MEKEVVVDTTVQEKNITFPTDVKLYRRIIEQCRKTAEEEKIEQRQSYKQTVKKLLMAQRFRNHPLNKKKAIQAEKKLKTIAGRLLRELERKLTAETKQLLLNSSSKSLAKNFVNIVDNHKSMGINLFHHINKFCYLAQRNNS